MGYVRNIALCSFEISQGGFWGQWGAFEQIKDAFSTLKGRMMGAAPPLCFCPVASIACLAGDEREMVR
jgi:hypothetical protein